MDNYTHLRGVGGIYRIVHIESGRCYIGRSGDIAKRWDAHIRDLTASTDHHSAYLQHAWNKYGANAFRFEVVVLESDPQRLIELEQYYLDKRLFERGSKEYNMSSSSRGPVGVKHSAEARARMSAAQKGRKRSPESIEKQKRTRDSHPPTWKELAWRELIKDANRQRLAGRPKSQEIREKIRAKLLGQPPSPAAQAANTARRGRPLNEKQIAANTARRGQPLSEKARAYHESQRGIVNEKLQARAWIGRQLGAKASAENPPQNSECVDSWQPAKPRRMRNAQRYLMR